MAGGRKPEFDKETALEAAMMVFWKKGYLGASLADLTDAMGINKPSLYAAFGNKETLFTQATAYYLRYCAERHTPCLYQVGLPLKERLANYLMSVIASQCDDRTPKGCYISLGVAESAGECMPTSALAAIESAGGYALQVLTEFMETDGEAKALKLDARAAENALFLVTLINGTAVMARAGKTQDDLRTVVDGALAGIGLRDLL